MVRLLAVHVCLALGLGSAHAQPAPPSPKSGAELYRAACAACHGADGRGAPASSIGRSIEPPDFTVCSFATPEADADWMAVVHEGGPVRAFDRMMPSFKEALSLDEIASLVSHLRTFCTDRRWPRGDLNLPRPLVTEKAFPENEAVVTTTVDVEGDGGVGNQFLYERRIGSRGQIEIALPLDFRERSAGGWSRGIGDIAIAFKHVVAHSVARGSIVSAGGEVVLPTGSESNGLGGGATVLEPFATVSQMLPRNAFLHVHAGLEAPLGADDRHKEVFWRAAIGKTYTEGWGRAWSPMIELLAAREIGAGEGVAWDVLPQMQVTLSTRQHVVLNGGVRVPLNQREGRGAAVMVYLLWDWFDGGFFSGW